MSRFNHQLVEERTHQEWVEAGADWAYFIVLFLKGPRRLDIQPNEIVETQLYKRSNQTEQRALRLVCVVETEVEPFADDAGHLRVRDQFLNDFVDGKSLGHGDWVEQLRSIPARVAERETFDRAYFRTTFDSPVLFRWVWGR